MMSAILSAPGVFVPITPSDVIDLTSKNFRGIYVGGAGNLAVDFGAGSFVVPVFAGSSLPMLGVKRVLATGTTATSIHGIS
jgi:hypothetical protein